MGRLVFLSTASVIAVLWIVIMGIVWANDPALFGSPARGGEILIGMIVLPLIVAPILSGFAMGFAALSKKKGAGFVLFFLTGLLAPFVSLLLVALGTLIARKLYIGPESKTVKPDSEPSAETRRPAWSPQSQV